MRRLEPRVSGAMLRVDLPEELRCISAAVLGGGIATVRTWVNLQVPAGYRRLDPAEHLAALTARFPAPVLGMLTAAPVDRYQHARAGSAQAVATTGLGIPLAAAGDPAGDPAPGAAANPARDPAPGTINILVVVDAPLTDAGLVGALQTGVEAKVQALADASVRASNAPGLATGTATDVLAVACPAGADVEFAGPATPVGADLARAVYQAVLRGCLAWHQER